MKRYETPELTIKAFEVTDVITASEQVGPTWSSAADQVAAKLGIEVDNIGTFDW